MNLEGIEDKVKDGQRKKALEQTMAMAKALRRGPRLQGKKKKEKRKGKMR